VRRKKKKKKKKRGERKEGSLEKKELVSERNWVYLGIGFVSNYTLLCIISF
jgi:hypothetical protein